MNVYFGNLTVKQLVDKCKLKSLTEEEIIELEKYRCNKANIEKDTFHIFDIPHWIHVNGKARDIVIDILGKYSKEFEIQYQVGEKEVTNEWCGRYYERGKRYKT